ncbi:LuxE family acyl-protein synthetase/acyl-CoA reductase-like protein [Blattabacterium sp. (Periplaneta americana) str. BPLAN]|uniref:LuxE/PaaK family acyltransferase n=1 Tax=Blattabacterium sp. (Periplaneta americana) TaxID=367488 RepID=UPI0001BA0C00|nr:LuxE family acyl-protein synthetase/acyl-CoA reductase [Blattabacterium sp. (Periplaneta americana)]ACX83898.1 LuxE family acyl-protein synthetase/acyl-CoA reductase-like protein [Blattabacterium sp. (Periplaneta americana) str. BPLAN]
MNFQKKIFSIESKKEFESLTLEIFNYQVRNNHIYRNYLQLLKIDPFRISNISEIPFFPISFFKTHCVCSLSKSIPEIIFTSTGTTGIKSKHYVTDLHIYRNSICKGFEYFYGPIEKFQFLALFPFYREDSSLIYMMKYLIQKTYKNGSNFIFFQKIPPLHHEKTILIFGISFSLLDFVESHRDTILDGYNKDNVILMETGGMKGKRKEIIREELHHLLKKGFCIKNIHSEYGMTELLSQAYAKKNGIFRCPPWMKVYIRDPEDPLIHIENHKIGGIDIIDLSNYLSCPFISTNDLGKKINDEEFEVLGRMDLSDVRGCSLMTF